MQPLPHPSHRSILPLDHRILLVRLRRIASGEARVLDAREMAILKWHRSREKRLKGMLFQLAGVSFIMLWRQDLSRDDAVGVFLLQGERGMADRDAVDQRRLAGLVELCGAEAEVCPAVFASCQPLSVQGVGPRP